MIINENRFSYGVRECTTSWEIKDKGREFPFIEPFFYESSARKVCDFLNDLNNEKDDAEHYHKTVLGDFEAICKDYDDLQKENKQLRKYLIDHSALIIMLEAYKALSIEAILWDIADIESEEDFDKRFKVYLDVAKKRWSDE